MRHKPPPWVCALAVVLIVGSLGSLSPLEAADRQTAKEILDRMVNVYGGAGTYRDSGSVRTVLVRDDGTRRVTEKSFKTAFVRPDWFRFEFSERMWSEEKGRYIIWARGRDVRTWWGIDPGVKTAPSVGHAIGAAAGVSGRASMTVPTLLLPNEIPGADQAGAKLIVYADPVRLPDEALGGVMCSRLQIRRNDEPATIWIDAATYMIRRIDSGHTFSDFRTETTTVYDPVIDAALPEALLAFSAPENPPSAMPAPATSGALSNAQETPRPQAVPPASSNAASGNDQHDAAVRKLIEVMGIGYNDGKLVDHLFEIFKKRFPDVPAAVWDDLRTQIATEEFAGLQVAMLKKHFSLDEVRGLLAFFVSPVGQRYLQEQPGLMEDGMALGQEFSRRAAERLQRCLQQKGYTLG